MGRRIRLAWHLGPLLAAALAACEGAESLEQSDAATRADSGADLDPTPRDPRDAGGLDGGNSSLADGGVTYDASLGDAGVVDESALDGGLKDGGSTTETSLAASILGAELVPAIGLEADLQLPADNTFPSDLLPPK